MTKEKNEDLSGVQNLMIRVSIFLLLVMSCEARLSLLETCHRYTSQSHYIILELTKDLHLGLTFIILQVKRIMDSSISYINFIFFGCDRINLIITKLVFIIS